MSQSVWANNDHTTIYVELENGLTADAIVHTERNLREMMGEVGHPVATVINVIDRHLIAMETLRALHKFLSYNHPNRAMMIMVVPDGMREGIQEMMQRSFGGSLPSNVGFGATLDDAELILQSQ